MLNTSVAGCNDPTCRVHGAFAFRLQYCTVFTVFSEVVCRLLFSNKRSLRVKAGLLFSIKRNLRVKVGLLFSIKRSLRGNVRTVSLPYVRIQSLRLSHVSTS